MKLRLEGPPGEVFTEIVRLLPDGRRWLISDPQLAVVIARDEGHLVREAILSAVDGEEAWDIEVLASKGVAEGVLQGLVGVALLVGFVAAAAAWLWGPGGLWGLVFGVVLAGTLPALTLAVGQRLVDPGRDSRAEANLERALRFAIAQSPRAALID